MKKIIFIFTIVLLAISSPMYSQIGINTDTPEPSSVLDMHSPLGADKGLLISQMTTAKKDSIISPANGLLVYDTDQNCISQNIGSENAPKWTCLTLMNRKFFYMPSINIPTDVTGPASRDLYTIYKNQFTATPPKNPTAPAAIPVYNATDLYYYVTYVSSPAVTVTGISDTGVMNYTVTAKADCNAYMNIVFVLK